MASKPYSIVRHPNQYSEVWNADGKSVYGVWGDAIGIEIVCNALNAAHAAGAASAEADARVLVREAIAYRAKRKAKREESADKWRAAQDAHTAAMKTTDSSAVLDRYKETK
jgi:hypothetical protein